MVTAALAACDKGPVHVSAAHRVTPAGVELTIETDRAGRRIELPGLSVAGGPAHQVRTVPWDKLAIYRTPSGDVRFNIQAVRDRDGERANAQVLVPAASVPASAFPGATAEPAAGAVTARSNDPMHVELHGSKDSGTTVHVGGLFGDVGEVSGDPPTLAFVAHPTATLELAGRAVALSDGRGAFPLVLEELLPTAQLSMLASSRSEPMLTVPAKLSAPGQEPKEGSLTVRGRAVGYALERLLEGVRSGKPVALGESAGKPSGVVLFVQDLYTPSSRTIHVGGGGRLADVKRVAWAEWTPERAAGSCRYTGGFVVKRVRRDLQITVYDPRSGKVVGRERLAARGGACPVTWTSYGGERSSSMTDRPEAADIERWLARASK